MGPRNSELSRKHFYSPVLPFVCVHYDIFYTEHASVFEDFSCVLYVKQQERGVNSAWGGLWKENGWGKPVFLGTGERGAILSILKRPGRVECTFRLNEL